MRAGAFVKKRLIGFTLLQLFNSNPAAAAAAAKDPSAQEEYSTQEEIDLANKIKTAQDQIKALESKLKSTQETLDREFDRNGKLRQKLLTEYKQGCRSSEKIKKLEIFVKGSHLPDSDWDRANTRAEKPDVGNPTNIVFSFGREISITQNNEDKSPVFTSAGYLVSKSFSNFTPADISMIKVTKGGSGFVSDLACWSIIGWTKWGIGKNCEWRNSETNRYALDSVEIKINDEIFFSVNQIGYNFSEQNFTWQESNLSKSTDYINFMTSTQCSEGN